MYDNFEIKQNKKEFFKVKIMKKYDKNKILIFRSCIHSFIEYK